jgi:beta-1,4-mannosyltransferase
VPDTLRMAPFPAGGGAPYLTLLHRALARTGVEVVPRGSVVDAANDGSVDVVHLHWLEYLTGGGRVRSHLRGIRLMRALRRLRRSRTRLIWTVHNLRPHEPANARLEDVLAREALACADGVIVHSAYARRRVSETYGGDAKLAVVPHGNFVGFYPPARQSRDDTRAALGLPRDAFTFLVFGQLRSYKRITAAVAAFREIRDPGVRLLVAGAPHGAIASELKEAAAGDARVLLRFGHVPDADVAELHAVADAVVLPYRQVFSSGALLLALSLGVPAVVPAEGAADLADPPAIEPFEEGGLSGALEAIRAGNPATRRAAALGAAERYRWESIAARTRELYAGGAA